MPVMSFADQQWYKTLIARPTTMLQLDEAALAAAGVSMLWALKNPRHAPAYRYKNRHKNLDPKVGGGIAARILLEGELPWLEQIKDSFNTEESLATYDFTLTGAHSPVYARSKAMKSLARGETILLSSEESICLNVEPTGGSGAATHAEPITVEPEVVADEPMQENPRVQTQPGTQTGVRHAEEEVNEDQTTIIQILEKKRKSFANAKHKLDIEAALNISEKKRK
ncbi:hypothetical protein Hanom_Chr03g00209081 [Helianthus anomalus]